MRFHEFYPPEITIIPKSHTGPTKKPTSKPYSTINQITWSTAKIPAAIPRYFLYLIPLRHNPKQKTSLTGRINITAIKNNQASLAKIKCKSIISKKLSKRSKLFELLAQDIL